jgi:hypothetical protein
MIQGIALGVGIGLAALGFMKFLLGRIYKEESSISIDSEESIPQEKTPETEVIVASVEEHSLNLASDTEAFCKEHEEAGISELTEDNIEDDDVAFSAGNPIPSEAFESKSWYLIRTTKGLLRTCRCSSRTSHTVAGPFATKMAARQAKEQYGVSEAQFSTV